MTNFSRNLRYLRAKKELTLKQLGERCGVTLGSLCCYEGGEYIPISRNLKKLADFFGVTMDELWRGELWKR